MTLMGNMDGYSIKESLRGSSADGVVLLVAGIDGVVMG
jgi:hypothetical protein